MILVSVFESLTFEVMFILQGLSPRTSQFLEAERTKEKALACEYYANSTFQSPESPHSCSVGLLYSRLLFAYPNDPRVRYHTIMEGSYNPGLIEILQNS